MTAAALITAVAGGALLTALQDAGADPLKDTLPVSVKSHKSTIGNLILVTSLTWARPHLSAEFAVVEKGPIVIEGTAAAKSFEVTHTQGGGTCPSSGGIVGGGGKYRGTVTIKPSYKLTPETVEIDYEVEKTDLERCDPKGLAGIGWTLDMSDMDGPKYLITTMRAVFDTGTAEQEPSQTTLKVPAGAKKLLRIEVDWSWTENQRTLTFDTNAELKASGEPQLRSVALLSPDGAQQRLNALSGSRARTSFALPQDVCDIDAWQLVVTALDSKRAVQMGRRQLRLGKEVSFLLPIGTLFALQEPSAPPEPKATLPVSDADFEALPDIVALEQLEELMRRYGPVIQGAYLGLADTGVQKRRSARHEQIPEEVWRALPEWVSDAELQELAGAHGIKVVRAYDSKFFEKLPLDAVKKDLAEWNEQVLRPAKPLSSGMWPQDVVMEWWGGGLGVRVWNDPNLAMARDLVIGAHNSGVALLPSSRGLNMPDTSDRWGAGQLRIDQIPMEYRNSDYGSTRSDLFKLSWIWAHRGEIFWMDLFNFVHQNATTVIDESGRTVADLFDGDPVYGDVLARYRLLAMFGQAVSMLQGAGAGGFLREAECSTRLIGRLTRAQRLAQEVTTQSPGRHRVDIERWIRLKRGEIKEGSQYADLFERTLKRIAMESWERGGENRLVKVATKADFEKYTATGRTRGTIRGYVTQEKYLKDLNAREMEKVLGYQKGALGDDGVWVLPLKRNPAENEFQLRGYTMLPGGKTYMSRVEWDYAKREWVERALSCDLPECKHDFPNSPEGVPQWVLGNQKPDNLKVWEHLYIPVENGTFVNPGEQYLPPRR